MYILHLTEQEMFLLTQAVHTELVLSNDDPEVLDLYRKIQSTEEHEDE